MMSTITLHRPTGPHELALVAASIEATQTFGAADT